MNAARAAATLCSEVARGTTGAAMRGPPEGCGRECVGFAGYRRGRTARSQPVPGSAMAGNGPFPATGIPLVVGLSAANTRIPLARWGQFGGRTRREGTVELVQRRLPR